MRSTSPLAAMPAPTSTTSVMFRIKICGLTDPTDVPGVVAAGADAIGLNFYAHSKRFVTLDRAAEIVSVLPTDVARVGVFVNAPLDEILSARDRCRLNYVQLHGDETPEKAKLVQDVLGTSTGLIRALRLRSEPQLEIEPYLDACRKLGVRLAAVLIDAFAPGQYGGTGHAVDWATLGRWTTRPEYPLILAGGLTGANVAQAIASARADGVDTAGGVETSPGRKDAALSRAFVAAAKTAFADCR